MRQIWKIDELSRFPIVDVRDVQWYEDSKPTCVGALITDNVDKIKELCDFNDEQEDKNVLMNMKYLF